MSKIFSMTGFATVQGTTGSQTGFTLSIKSVNHRFLDMGFRLPPQCDGLEIQIRRVLKEKLRRGHVDVTLQMERKNGGQMQVNADTLAAHVEIYREAARSHGIASDPDLNVLLRIPGVITMENLATKDDMAGLETAVIAELEPLVAKLNVVRAEEGAVLAEELRRSMRRLGEAATEVAELRVGVREAQFERLSARIGELLNGSPVNEERLLSEAAVLAERSDIDEEVVRLRTHVDRFLAMLDEGGELGKRLDFLLQELNREANTMLSKTSGATGSNGLRITELGLEMKAEIEKAREQVQNLE